MTEAHDKRRSIAAAAANLFDAKGYHRVNMTDIAHAVGLQKPSLYHYFPSKSLILFAIHEDFFNPALERAEAFALLPPRQALRELMVDILRLMESHPGHLRVVFEHHRELEADEQAIIRFKRDRYQEIVESVIRRGIAQGEFRDVDQRISTLAIFGMCNWAYQWYKPGLLTPEEIGTFMADLILTGLHARS